jgi:hypothetical protein
LGLDDRGGGAVGGPRLGQQQTNLGQLGDQANSARRTQVINTEVFSLNGWDNVAVSMHGGDWVHVAGKFLDENDQVVPNSEFGVYTGKTVYLSPLPSGKYKLQYNVNWRTPSTASPTFTVQVRQDVPHRSQLFWLGLGIMGLPVCIMLHHWFFDARRWSNSDFSPYSSG